MGCLGNPFFMVSFLFMEHSPLQGNCPTPHIMGFIMIWYMWIIFINTTCQHVILLILRNQPLILGLSPAISPFLCFSWSQSPFKCIIYFLPPFPDPFFSLYPQSYSGFRDSEQPSLDAAPTSSPSLSLLCALCTMDILTLAVSLLKNISGLELLHLSLFLSLSLFQCFFYTPG